MNLDYIKLSNGNKINITNYYEISTPEEIEFKIPYSSSMSIDGMKKEFEENGDEITLYNSEDVQIRSAWENFNCVKFVTLEMNVPEGEETDYVYNVLSVHLKHPDVQFATQEEIDILSDAIAEMSEIIYGEE